VALTAGFERAFGIAAGFAVAGALVALLVLKVERAPAVAAAPAFAAE
jgi:hypothetical protein